MYTLSHSKYTLHLPDFKPRPLDEYVIVICSLCVSYSGTFNVKLIDRLKHLIQG